MHQTRINILTIFITAFITSCINPYDPDIDEVKISKYVVNGLVSDRDEIQSVLVSIASDVGEPRFIPVEGCRIAISDNQGNVFPLTESGAGNYSVRIDRSHLLPGISFKVEINVPGGTRIESDYDMMPDCPDIDSVYFIRRDIIMGDPLDAVKGIQFYIDLDGSNSETRFFRWEVEETWEYRVPYPREWYYDGQVHHIFPPDYSRQVCWSTEHVQQIFTLSTAGLVQNKYEKLPVNFVDNTGPKLVYGYSLLVSQFSLSEASFSYWDRMRDNNFEQGGLYDQQPMTITGNLHNITFPDQQVLGFFGASSVKSKRIFVKEVENLDIEYVPPCSRYPLRMGFRELKPEDIPVYLFGDEYGFSLIIMGDECVDCLVLGGRNFKPEYWPW